MSNIEPVVITAEDLKKEAEIEALNTDPPPPNTPPENSEEVEVVVPESDSGIEIIHGDDVAEQQAAAVEATVEPVVEQELIEAITPPVPAEVVAPVAETIAPVAETIAPTVPAAVATLPQHVLNQLQRLVDLELSSIDARFGGLGQYLDPTALATNGEHIFVIQKEPLLKILASVATKPESLAAELGAAPSKTPTAEEIKTREIERVLGIV